MASLTARSGFIVLRLLLLAGLWLGMAEWSVRAAAAPAERRAFNIAQVLFNDGAFDLAERELSEFVKNYPDSPHRSEALLLQARARYSLKNLAGTVELLQTHLPQAGHLTDEYRFWMAEAHYQSQQYAAAAAAYAQLLKDFPKSRRRLEATYGEAFCRFKLQEWARVRELLGNPDGEFQQLTKDRPQDELAARGYLLLAETALGQKEFRLAEATLLRLQPDRLPPALAWQRQNLLCRLQLTEARLAEALTNSFKLLDYARASQQRPLLADAVALNAGIFERMQQYDQAVRVYETNLTEIASPEQRRQALLKVIELTLAQNQTALAIQKLTAFATNLPGDPAQDLAQLTLGELKFKQHLEPPPPAATNAPPAATNLLQSALAHFNRVISDFPQSPLLGKAFLQRGWCHWLQGDIEGSQSGFRQAAERLPPSPDQAVALFKLGDTYLWQKDYSNALAQFSLVISNYVAIPAVKETLLDQALYQMLRASIALGDTARAQDAFQKIITWFPESYYSDRSMLSLGQAQLVKQPGQARAVFAQMLEKFPQSPLAAEARLAMARTFVQENRWEEAIVQYNAWAAHDSARRQLPEAEFDRAWVNYRAGRETNALDLFTRFVADFPTNHLAPRAQYWIANHHFGLNDLTNAEANFQIIFQNTNWPRTNLTFQAQLMAGRVALARQSMKDATNYFISIINDQACPSNILLAAYFAYGDTMIDLPVVEADNPFRKYSFAITLFEKIPQTDPASPMVPAAWGRIGDCYLQLAARDPAYYEEAIKFYLKSMTNAAEVAVRSQAEIGLGLVREKQAALTPPQKETLLANAFNHYRNVLYGLNLRNEEKAHPFWVKEAAMRAARLKESMQDYPAAIVIYQRLKACLPALEKFCDDRIKSLQELIEGRTPP